MLSRSSIHTPCALRYTHPPLLLGTPIHSVESAYGQELKINCTLGNGDEVDTRDYQVSGIYLNVEHPAECSGSLIAWRFCHYSPLLIFEATYSASIQIWRQTSTDIYTRIAVNTQEDDIIPENKEFSCHDVSLELPVRVEKGDVFGIHLPSVRGLRMVSRSKPGDKLLLDELEGESDALFVKQLSTTSMQKLTQHVLHLSGVIGKPLDRNTNYLVPCVMVCYLCSPLP